MNAQAPQTDAAPAPQTDLPLSEVIDSMTGYDELAVAKHFDDFNVYDVAGQGTPRPRDMVMLLRVGVFVLGIHNGDSALVAHEAAMSLTSKQANDYFPDDPDDVDPDEPDSSAGKGSSEPA